jgi:hypothetical protein
MTDKDHQTVRTPRSIDDSREKREEGVEGAEAGTRKKSPVDDTSRGRLNRVYSDVRIRAHHTNAELKMMRGRASGFEEHHKKF